MAITYKVDIMAALREAGYSSTRLRHEKLMGESYMQQLLHLLCVVFLLSRLGAMYVPLSIEASTAANFCATSFCDSGTIKSI